jgi:hypothetical protein
MRETIRYLFCAIFSLSTSRIDRASEYARFPFVLTLIDGPVIVGIARRGRDGTRGIGREIGAG